MRSGFYSQMTGATQLSVEPRSQFDLGLKSNTCTSVPGMYMYECRLAESQPRPNATGRRANTTRPRLCTNSDRTRTKKPLFHMYRSIPTESQWSIPPIMDNYVVNHSVNPYRRTVILNREFRAHIIRSIRAELNGQ